MIFVDTSAFFAMMVENDVNHLEAQHASTQVESGEFGVMVTTDYIISELITLMRVRVGHQQAVEAYESIDSSPNVRTAPVAPAIRRSAFDIFRSSPDKDYSFTDCTSFAAMRSLGIDKAFTFDDHFRQAGFFVVP